MIFLTIVAVILTYGFLIIMLVALISDLRKDDFVAAFVFAVIAFLGMFAINTVAVESRPRYIVRSTELSNTDVLMKETPEGFYVYHDKEVGFVNDFKTVSAIKSGEYKIESRLMGKKPSKWILWNMRSEVKDLVILDKQGNELAKF